MTDGNCNIGLDGEETQRRFWATFGSLDEHDLNHLYEVVGIWTTACPHMAEYMDGAFWSEFNFRELLKTKGSQVPPCEEWVGRKLGSAWLQCNFLLAHMDAMESVSDRLRQLLQDITTVLANEMAVRYVRQNLRASDKSG